MPAPENFLFRFLLLIFFRLLSVDLSDDQVNAMMKEADEDNDGNISFEEFKRMMA